MSSLGQEANIGPSECDDVIRRAHVSRRRGLPHREGTGGLHRPSLEGREGTDGLRRPPSNASVSSSRISVGRFPSFDRPFQLPSLPLPGSLLSSHRTCRQCTRLQICTCITFNRREGERCMGGGKGGREEGARARAIEEGGRRNQRQHTRKIHISSMARSPAFSDKGAQDSNTTMWPTVWTLRARCRT